MNARKYAIENVAAGWKIAEDEIIGANGKVDPDEWDLGCVDWQRVVEYPTVRYGEGRVRVALAYYNNEIHVEDGFVGQTVAVLTDDDGVPIVEEGE
jgi:hypothetical protein